jgi:AcrR family transcriptional regulator
VARAESDFGSVLRLRAVKLAQSWMTKNHSDVVSPRTHLERCCPAVTSSAPHISPASTALRADPIQARSTKRLEDLLDAAARYIHDNGYETLTTNHVSALSGSSIGTVYRYFPDRIALLDALIMRNLERTKTNTINAFRSSTPGSLEDAIDGLVEVMAQMFRHEPGFRSIRLGDSLDIRPARPERWGNRALAKLSADELGQLWGAREQSHEVVMEHAIDAADAFLTKAFLAHDSGDPKTIVVAQTLAKATVSLV